MLYPVSVNCKLSMLKGSSDTLGYFDAHITHSEME